MTVENSLNYVPLHVHTHWSLLDGVARPQEYIDVIKNNGQSAIAITDHGTLSGHSDFWHTCVSNNVKPILGIEAYYTEDRFDRRDKKSRTPDDLIYNHLVILAKNTKGLRNLNRMSELAWTEGYFYKPRMDWELLSTYGEDVIILSGCMSGPIARPLMDGDFLRAKAIATRFSDRFDSNFYVEVMPHNSEELNKQLLQLADSLGIKSVVTPDCHHATADQKVIQEFMLLLNTHQQSIKGKTYADICKCSNMMDGLDCLYGSERQMTFRNFDIHLLGPQEMWSAMLRQDIRRTDIFENTVSIAAQIGNYEIPTACDLLPVEYTNPDATLRSHAIKGLKERGLTTKEYKERLDDELAIIKSKGFAPYFLMVHNITNYAHNNDILMSPGRGSAAGSLVSYALGITDIDPIVNNLLFFRFIDGGMAEWSNFQGFNRK